MMRFSLQNKVICAATLLAGLALGGCSKTMQTTRSNASDMMWAEDVIAANWAASEYLAKRNADSPPIRLVPREMENRSSDRLSRVDQRAAVARVLEKVQDILDEKAISVMWPPEDMALLKRHGIEVPPLAAADQPTHVFRAEFSSIVRAAGEEQDAKANERIDRFAITYSIIDLQTRRIDWSDRVEFARAAHGILAD